MRSIALLIAVVGVAAPMCAGASEQNGSSVGARYCAGRSSLRAGRALDTVRLCEPRQMAFRSLCLVVIATLTGAAQLEERARSWR